MLKLIILLIFPALLFFCTKINPIKVREDGINSLDTLHNPIKFEVGDKWHYKDCFVNLRDSGNPPSVPETLYAFMNYEAVKDTIIESENYIIVECDYWECSSNFNLLHSRQAIHFGKDSIKIFYFRTSGGFIDVLLKSKSNANGLVLDGGATLLELKRNILAKKLNLASFDTDIFIDLIYPVVFPLIKNSSWYYRPPGSPWGHLPMKKTYLGQDTVTVPAGTFEAYKIEWELNEALAGYFMDDIYGFEWLSTDGIVKRYYDFGMNEYTDETGNSLGAFHTYDIYEYMGPFNKYVDTSLYGFPAAVKAFVDSHYSNEKFLAYYNFIHRNDYNADSLFLYWEKDPFTRTLSYFTEQAVKSDDYYDMVCTYNEFVQGWDDVMPDMVADDFSFIYNQRYGTEYDYRFRGWAIESIATSYNGTIVDTTWMYYNDSTKTSPKYLGHSANQDRAEEMKDSLLLLLN